MSNRRRAAAALRPRQMEQRAVIFPDEHAAVIVIKAGGDPGILLNPAYGLDAGDVGRLLVAMGGILIKDSERDLPTEDQAPDTDTGTGRRRPRPGPDSVQLG